MAPLLSALFTEVFLVYRLRVFTVGLAVLLLAACQPLPASPTAAPTIVQLPAESSQLSPMAAPTAVTVLPTPSSVTAATGDRFQLDRPVSAGDTLVTGSGPKGTAISLFDLTRMGIELGATTIGEDGRFAIEVEPLTGNVRIGIQLTEPNDAIWADKSLLGPEAMVVPLVGSFVDTALVAP